jgi:hypothetical protein
MTTLQRQQPARKPYAFVALINSVCASPFHQQGVSGRFFRFQNLPRDRVTLSRARFCRARSFPGVSPCPVNPPKGSPGAGHEDPELRLGPNGFRRSRCQRMSLSKKPMIATKTRSAGPKMIDTPGTMWPSSNPQLAEVSYVGCVFRSGQ